MEQFTLKFTFLYKYLWWSKFINWYQIDMLWLLFWLMIILCSFSNHEFRSSSFLINYWNQTSAWKRKGPLGLKNWILFSSTVGEILQFLCSFPNLVLKFKIHFQLANNFKNCLRGSSSFTLCVGSCCGFTGLPMFFYLKFLKTSFRKN